MPPPTPRYALDAVERGMAAAARGGHPRPASAVWSAFRGESRHRGRTRADTPVRRGQAYACVSQDGPHSEGCASSRSFGAVPAPSSRPDCNTTSNARGQASRHGIRPTSAFLGTSDRHHNTVETVPGMGARSAPASYATALEF